MKIENRQQLLVIVTAIAVALLFADRFVFTPLGHEWSARSDRIAALHKQIDDGDLLIRREDSLRERWDQLQTNTLPVNASVAGQTMLNAVDRWSQDSRTTILSITPQWKQDADDYMTLDCRVEASGTLSTLSRFLYEIEKDPMALRLESVELSARDNDGQQLALGLQLSGLILTPEQSTR
jgi:Tfp pilus assembly protein PilO